MNYANPFVSVIVTHHLNQNQKYLDLTLATVLGTQGIEYECICVSDSKEPPRVPVHSRLRNHHFVTPTNASEKLAFAIEHLIHPASKVILLISDDVMVTPRTIDKLAGMANGNQIIVGPMSNGDNGSRYATQFNLRGYSKDRLNSIYAIPITLTLEELETQCPNYMEAMTSYPDTHIQELLLPQLWLSFYCVAIPRPVIKRVGFLDARLDVRHNDQDYCIRANKEGIKSYIHTGAFALHFGSKTLYNAHSPDEFNQATKVFKEKYDLK